MTRKMDSVQNFKGIVMGRVQGVGYRVFARECARKRKVNGWVRNLADGNVEVWAEGEELELTEFLTDLYRGPVLGHITNIDLEWGEGEPRYSEFSILS